MSLTNVSLARPALLLCLLFCGWVSSNQAKVSLEDSIKKGVYKNAIRQQSQSQPVTNQFPEPTESRGN